MEGTTLANKIHELKHGGQSARGELIILGNRENVSLSFTKGMNLVSMEVEAYKAQYAFNPESMPTSTISMISYNEINGKSVGSIYSGYQITGEPNWIYPWIHKDYTYDKIKGWK